MYALGASLPCDKDSGLCHSLPFGCARQHAESSSAVRVNVVFMVGGNK